MKKITSSILTFGFFAVVFTSDTFSQKPSASPESTSPDKKAVTQLIGPGVGAYTEDARTIFRAAGKAAGLIKKLSYDAIYQGNGAMATRSPVANGKVTFSMLAANDPLKAKIAASGKYFPTGSDETSVFNTTFDGSSVRRLRSKEKILVKKTLSPGDPKERTLGFVTSFFGAGPYQLLMLEFLQDSPFARQADAPVADYEGRTTISGVLCHVIYVEHSADSRDRISRERWYLGVEDSLPRGFEQIVSDNDGRFGSFSLTLSNIRTDFIFNQDTFVATLPKGYTAKLAQDPPKPELLNVGDSAPDWNLFDADGREHKLADYRGKLIVIDFWATWCGPCIRAMPDLQKLHNRFSNRDVKVFGINVWEESNAPEFMKRSGYTYGLLLKGEQVANAYRVPTLPTLYVIGTDGKIIHRIKGLDDNLAEFIDTHLKSLGK